MKAILKLALPVVAATLVGGSTASGQEQKPQIPLIQMENVPLSAAIENLALLAEANFTIDPKLNDTVGTPVTIRWENLTAKAALARLLKERGHFMVENPQTGVTKISATNSPPRVFDKELFSRSKEVIPMIRLMDAPLPKACADLGGKAGLKLELDAELSDPSRPFKEQVFVSVRFGNLTAAQALAAICDQYDLQITKSEGGDVWRISRRK